MVVTVVAWVVLTAVYAYVYVTHRLALPDAVGYEKAWDWQLFFFGLVRFPILVVFLLIVLWIESRVLSERH
jgi:hypothetical protein